MGTKIRQVGNAGSNPLAPTIQIGCSYPLSPLLTPLPGSLLFVIMML
jgi:hypothetical protein